MSTSPHPWTGRQFQMRYVNWAQDESSILGRGSFGTVYAGVLPANEERHLTETDVAVRVIAHPTTLEGQRMTMREIESRKAISHPCVIGYLGASLAADEWMIVTERGKTDIAVALREENMGIAPSWTTKDGKTVQWNSTKKTIAAAGIALGLCHVHSMRYVHRDVKPNNIILDENMYPKISGFGLTRDIPSGADGNTDRMEMTLNVGTPLYMAPEVFDDERGGYNFKVDVYAYGMVLYELATGRKPFDDMKLPTMFKLFKRVLSGERPEIPDYVNPLWGELMKRCWAENPDDRPTMKEVVDTILQHRDEFALNDCDVNEFEDYLDAVTNHK